MRLAISTAIATALGVALALGLAATPAAAQECSLTIEGNDQLQYNKDRMEVPAGCDTIKVTLKNTGSLPRNAAGHNWTLTEPGDAQAVATAGTAAGLQNDYLPQDDDRVIASTDLVGGGEQTSVEVDVSALDSGEYTFLCTFPGHFAAGMKGTLVVS